MKIFSAEQIRKADQYTIENEPIRSLELMDRAASRFTSWFVNHFDISRQVHIFCGTGNNGGDGMVVSQLLHKQKWNVHTYYLNPKARQSEDFKVNYLSVNEYHEVIAIEKTPDIIYPINKNDIVIDAIFGSGLSRPAEGIYGEVIQFINSSGAEIISVDIPSGLFADKHSSGENIIKADHVISFQLPKLAFFLPENGDYVKQFHIVDIGLHPDILKSEKTNFFTTEGSDIKDWLPERNKHAYKNKFGHGLIIAGSYGKMGAAILSSKACLRSGVGLLTVHVPQCGYEIMQTSVPEAMISVDSSPRLIHSIPELSKFNVVGIGPGIDTDIYTAEALGNLFKAFNAPIVIDADALNLIAEHTDLQDLIPENSILTPHPGEFKRLAGAWSDEFERLEMQRAWSKKHKVIIVLKGAYTSVSLPNGDVYFNTTGNPGMATAGSGDVLTGVITALLAQGLQPEHAAKAGVFLHGLAGDIASKYFGTTSMIAGDIIEGIPEAINRVRTM